MTQRRPKLPPRTSVFHVGRDHFVRKLQQSRGHLTASATLAFGYVAQLAFQMGYFLILTRMLGAERFGQFAAALAAINVISPIAGIGYAEVALVRVSQDRDSTGLWASNALAVTTGMGIGLAVCLASVSGMLDASRWLDWYLMFGLAISELVLVRCCMVIARVHQARREIGRTSLINISIAATKALIALCLFLTGHTSLVTLIILLDLCLSLLLICYFRSLSRRSSNAPISYARLKSDFQLACSFATGVFCKAVYTDMDKLFLARWSTASVVGTYAAGYKILSLSFTPIRAILEATFPRQIELAECSRGDCARFTRSILLINLVLAAGLAGLIYMFAPWATLLFGDDFQGSVAVLRIGFLLPVVQAVHYTLGNFLTATNHQSFRTIMQIVVLVVYIVVGLIVIPLYSWHGAIWTSLGCETLLAMLLATGCLLFSLRARDRMHSVPVK
ncbi:lipopolysaccharide biosynthesis protein [Novipirellula artificiosorum]|uniref:Polysaccharide biosynthesis protein n=1 Tax=Novipirellula artificiosorum TaxID=2528016 RepID=A0A5C6DR06_9BACT|nr:lipopolysaccharide biosynthesis protein [Novipirellula artificiosorum]TWU39198.1 Polysaccharide biosynthesis protein [Novipirellula artificiosorum]